MLSDQCFLPVHHCEEGLSHYGYLYDVNVQVLPTSESVIIDTLNESASRLVPMALRCTARPGHHTDYSDTEYLGQAPAC